MAKQRTYTIAVVAAGLGCCSPLCTTYATPPRPRACAQVLRNRGACPRAPAAAAAAPSHAARSTSCRALRCRTCPRERRRSGGETAAGDGRGQWQQGFGAPPGVAAARRDSWRQGEERGEGGFMHRGVQHGSCTSSQPPPTNRTPRSSPHRSCPPARVTSALWVAAAPCSCPTASRHTPRR